MQNYQQSQTLEQKAEWGNGVWQAEPDVASWTDDGTGLPVEVRRHPENGTLTFAVGVPDDHAAAGKDTAEVPYLTARGRPSTERRDGKWWFTFSFDQAGDGHPGKQHNIERYRNLLEVQQHATDVAHQLHRFAGQTPRIGGSASLPEAVKQARAVDQKTTEIPHYIRQKEDDLGVGDQELRKAADHSISGPAETTPAPPSNELAGGDSGQEAAAEVTGDAEVTGVEDIADVPPEDLSDDTTAGSSRRRKRH
jgi:hypothetical protein